MSGLYFDHWMVLRPSQRRAFLHVLTFCVALFATAADAASQWRLSIEGHHRYEFGERPLHGYVQIPWRVLIDFTVDQGELMYAVGSAQWLEATSTGGQPADWIECRLIAGSYLDASLHLQQMPRVRLQRFPLAGRVDQGVLTLVPGYQPPGNYLAVQYRCSSDRAAASEWFMRAQRARNEEGKRQDSETQEQGAHREAVVREVKTLPPAGELQLPLQDGWFFQEGDEDAAYLAQYRLQRLEVDQSGQVSAR